MSNKQYTLSDLKIGVIREATIKPEPIEMPNSEGGDKPIAEEYTNYMGDLSKMFSHLPLIKINKLFTVSPANIKKFSLDMTRWMPTVYMTIADPGDELKSKYYPTDGSVINIYIATIGDEKKYRPFRMDFIVTSVYESGGLGGTVMSEGSSEFTITGELNVPKLYYNQNMFESGTSFDALSGITEKIGLGFASNVEFTNDQQLWINDYTRVSSFLERISQHGYLDDESFFVSFIDPYYNLNYVEVSRLFSQLQDNEKCTVYNTAFRNEENSDESAEEETIPEDEQDFMQWEGRSHEWWYELNNSKFLSAWTLYYDKYSELNNGSTTLYDGYVKYVQSWNHKNRDYISSPVVVDNMETEGMLPLNKGKLVNGEPSELSANLKTYEYIGECNEHMNSEYAYAESHNDMNIKDMRKFGMVVDLPCINPAVTRYSRIKLIVFEKNGFAKEGLFEDENLTEDSVIQNENGETKNLSEVPGAIDSNTPRIDTSTEEGKKEAKKLNIYSEMADESDVDANGPAEVLNESLSGWYVVTGYEIYVRTNEDPDGNEIGTHLRQKIYLSRREYKPALKNDYMDNTKPHSVGEGVSSAISNARDMIINMTK